MNFILCIYDFVMNLVWMFNHFLYCWFMFEVPSAADGENLSAAFVLQLKKFTIFVVLLHE